MNYFLQTNIFLLFFYALYWLLLRRETFFRWNRSYLLVSVGLSLTIPLVKMPEFVQRSTQNIRIPAPIEQIVIAPLPVEVEQKAVVKEVSTFRWREWLVIGYWGVFLVLLVRLFISIGWLWYLGRGSIWQKEERYYLKTLPAHPQSFSFFNTLFLGNTAGLDDGQVRQIIQHELAHIRQKHSLDIIFLEIVTLLFWINPIGYFYKKSIRKVHEYLADKATLAYQNNKRAYSNLILKQGKGI